jgi:hypothetical protein
MFECAILVVGGQSSLAFRDSSAGLPSEPREILAGLPLACHDVLGQSVLHRTILVLRRAGIQAISVLTDDLLADLVPELPTQSVEIGLVRRPVDLWYAAERRLEKYLHCGITTALLIRLGTYAEFDWGDFWQFHRDKHQAVTPILDHQGPLDVWAVDAAHMYSPGVGLRLTGLMGPQAAVSAAPYHLHGYVNHLANARDFRRLVIDAFLSRCAIRPDGAEKKPGVWVDDAAQVHRRARVVAPAYIGRRAYLQAGTLVTRFSNLEHDCRVAHGTVIEDASVLAHTRLGTGLDVSHAVVKENTLVHLRHNVAVEINDPTVAGSTATRDPRRSLAGDTTPLTFPLPVRDGLPGI